MVIFKKDNVNMATCGYGNCENSSAKKPSATPAANQGNAGAPAGQANQANQTADGKVSVFDTGSFKQYASEFIPIKNNAEIIFPISSSGSASKISYPYIQKGKNKGDIITLSNKELSLSGNGIAAPAKKTISGFLTATTTGLKEGDYTLSFVDGTNSIKAKAKVAEDCTKIADSGTDGYLAKITALCKATYSYVSGSATSFCSSSQSPKNIKYDSGADLYSDSACGNKIASGSTVSGPVYYKKSDTKILTDGIKLSWEGDDASQVSFSNLIDSKQAVAIYEYDRLFRDVDSNIKSILNHYSIVVGSEIPVLVNLMPNNSLRVKIANNVSLQALNGNKCDGAGASIAAGDPIGTNFCISLDAGKTSGSLALVDSYSSNKFELKLFKPAPAIKKFNSDNGFEWKASVGNRDANKVVLPIKVAKGTALVYDSSSIKLLGQSIGADKFQLCASAKIIGQYGKYQCDVNFGGVGGNDAQPTVYAHASSTGDHELTFNVLDVNAQILGQIAVTFATSDAV